MSANSWRGWYPESMAGSLAELFDAVLTDEAPGRDAITSTVGRYRLNSQATITSTASATSANVTRDCGIPLMRGPPGRRRLPDSPQDDGGPPGRTGPAD
ncbi:Uncharacterised protein [Mycobacteroides abscessus subsp. abscessus]|nr:Uncharacterised protein [Mycobacteroides abscessus subsp. abscessus]SKX57753.1 Uncharacterised protein [Mycobacteroides abscessus subsp. abscessus]SKX90423.1 Uncharacterised protein [Mycobacteroides abscessus subsp. abscessus]